MRAVIAQSDLLTAYGLGIDAIWKGLIAGRTAITSVNPFASTASAPPLAMVPDLTVAPGSSRIRAMLDRLLAPLAGTLPADTTLILATTVGEIEAIEQSVLQDKPELAATASPQFLLQEIQRQLGLQGRAMVLSSACASSSAALSRAAAMVEAGESPAVLIVTADAVSEFVYAGFATLLSLCETSARPFDAGHCGLSLGEGAAWALITPEDSPLAANNSPVILGWCSTADTVHMTAPDRNAGGLTRAITSACSMARVDPKQIGLIAAHGTATLYNDTMEMQAFANAIAQPTPTFSIKGGTGHTLAAAGLMQILVACRAMQLKVAPPTVGLVTPAENAAGWAQATPVALADPTILLSTNSGFGGVNTAVILAHPNSPGRKAADRPANRAATQIETLTPGTGPGMGPCACFTRTECISIIPGGGRSKAKSPSLSSTKEISDFLGFSPKYLPRMTEDARAILIAASLAMRAAGWDDQTKIGIIGCDFDGCLAANSNYFQDYITQGRTIGRANLFIYTLPTSALSEVAIALSLRGPTLHVHGHGNWGPLSVMRAIDKTEADGMLFVSPTPEFVWCHAMPNR